MTNKDILQAYYKRFHLTAVGSEYSMEPIHPFILMDITYQLLNTHIAPLKPTFKLGKVYHKWRDTYSHFNQRFFSAFDEDQTDYVIDKMEDFENYVDNYVTIARLKIMDCFPENTLEEQQVVSACILTNILARAAHIITQKVYQKDYLDRTIMCNDLDEISRQAMRFCNLYRTSKPYYPPSEVEEVNSAVMVLCKKLVWWTAEDVKTQSTNGTH